MPETNKNMKQTEEEEILRVGEDTTEPKVKEEKKFTQEEVDNILGKERARIKRKFKKEEENKFSKSKELEDLLRTGLELEENEDVVSKVREFYENQGIELPKNHNISNHDALILGKADANEYIEDYDDKEIEARANELALKQQKGKTTERENAEFFALGEYLTNKNEEKELKEKGVDTEILKDKDFKKFAKQFNSNVKMSDVYEIYSKMGSEKPKKPVSTGSIKSTGTDKINNDFYTSEELDKLTKKDLDNPNVFKRAMESMRHLK